MSPMPGTTGVIHEHPAESNTAEDLAGEIDVKGGKDRGRVFHCTNNLIVAPK